MCLLKASPKDRTALTQAEPSAELIDSQFTLHTDHIATLHCKASVKEMFNV